MSGYRFGFQTTRHRRPSLRTTCRANARPMTMLHPAPSYPRTRVSSTPRVLDSIAGVSEYWMPAGACHRAALCADPLAGMTEDIPSRSRDGIRPSFANSFRPKIRAQAPLKRGRREDRVHAAPAVSRAWKQIAKRTRAYRFSGGNPAFPARWCYGFLRALPGDRAFLPPSPAKSGCFSRT
jgi:hypothetical protein